MTTKLIYSADSTFHIGQMHINHIAPCQDYADTLMTTERDKAFLVVSDGCSSGGQTDIGSRFIARKLLKQAKHQFDSQRKNFSGLGWYDISGSDLDSLALQANDLYATAFSCYADQNGLCIYLYGDGVAAFVETNGIVRLEHLNWQKNMPFYPFYASKLGRVMGLYDAFLEQHRGSEKPFSQTSVILKDGHIDSYNETKHSLDQGMAGVRLERNFPELMETRLVALFSDGVNQISDNLNQSPLDWFNVVQECLAFKNTTGDFVKRRVRRAIQNWGTQNLYPQDDFSCSVMLIEKEREEPQWQTNKK